MDPDLRKPKVNSEFAGLSWDEAGNLSFRRVSSRTWLSEADAETLRLVNEGYVAFWERRGKAPPPVSSSIIDVVPNDLETP